MTFNEQAGLRYYFFEIFSGLRLVQAVITRRGGVSSMPWASLNLGGTVGDDPAHVRENRQRAFAGLGLDLHAMYDVWQVHSAEVVLTGEPRLPNQPHLQADAILTDRPGLTLFMRFADCVPILLYDPRHKAAGLVHAGWKGTVKQAAGRAVAAMQAAYGSRPDELLAAIGPSIGPHHYEVGQEVVEQVWAAFGPEASGLLHGMDGGMGVQFDLWSANRLVLERAGVRQVEVSGICTACNLPDWYSHRGEHGATGRFGALISILE